MLSKIRLAINGFGRIGRAAFKIGWERQDIEFVAINDLGDIKTMAHLLKYDSIYGIWDKEIDYDEQGLIINKKRVPILKEKEPMNLPWKKMGVDIVLESTGIFLDKESSMGHIKAGAKRVIISAPAKGEDIPTYILGVNEEKLDASQLIISNGSCTTNCLAPIVKILDDNFGLDYGFMTTVHAYTNDQKILDLPHKDLRRARAAGFNMIPTTSGATKTVVDVLPHLKGRLDGLAIRVPIPVVSLVDFVCLTKKEVNVSLINQTFEQASKGVLSNIIAVTNEPLVSSDFKGDTHSAIVDLSLTQVQNNNLVKIIAWYDNEWGYSQRYIELAEYLGREI